MTDQDTTNQAIIDAAAEANKRERIEAMDRLFDAVIDVVPGGMPTEDVMGTFLQLLVTGIIQVHPRVKQDALDAAKRLGEKLPSFVEREWGSPGHQNHLGKRSREVN
jgi:hypothetical protein